MENFNNAPSLLRKVALLDGESLPSFLYRMATANHYQPFTLFKGLLQDWIDQQGVDDRCTSPKTMQAFEVIASLCGEDSADAIFLSTVQRFSSVILPLKDQILSTSSIDSKSESLLRPEVIRNHFRPDNMAVFCPGCLKERLYHRLSWSLLAHTACTKHKCLLVDRCQTCQSRLRIEDIVSGRCPKCDFDLLGTQTVDLTIDELGLEIQQLLLSLFFESFYTGALKGVPKVSSYVLYSLFYGLRSYIQSRTSNKFIHSFPGEKRFTRLPKGTSKKAINIELQYKINVTAVKALLDWPINFYEFLDKFRDQKNNEIGLGLGNFFWSWLEDKWSSSEFDFVQTAYNNYLLQNQRILRPNIHKAARIQSNPELIRRFQYITSAYAAELLQVSYETVDRLVANGTLRCLNPKNRDFDLGYIVLQDDVYSVLEMWQETISLNEASKYLGVSNAQTVELVEEGLLIAPRGRSTDGSSIWKISKSSVQSLHHKVFSSISLHKPDHQLVPLSNLLQQLAGWPVGISYIVQEIVNGDIQGFALSDDEDQIRKIVFPYETAQIIKDRIIHKNRWITVGQFAKQMHVKAKTVNMWIKDGAITPSAMIGNVIFLNAEDANSFDLKYVNTEIAAQILGVNELTVQKWARNGRLRPVSGHEHSSCHAYLFLRSEVNRMRKENRLTATEMAARLGISRSTLSAWIKKGKITPISGPGIDNSKHYMFLLP